MSEETLVYKRVLRQVMLWNLGLLAGLGFAGWMADSSALMANAIDNGSDAAVYLLSYMAVSYTHLDVYKRQFLRWIPDPGPEGPESGLVYDSGPRP